MSNLNNRIMKKQSTTRISTTILFLTLFSFSIFSANYETNSNGYYTNSSTWSSGYPGTTIGTNQNVTIKHGVTLNRNLTVYGILTIQSSATLQGSRYINVKPGGKVIINGTLGLSNLYVYGTLNNASTLSVYYDLTINANASATNSGNTSIGDDLQNSGTFANSGSLSVNDVLHNDAAFTNTGTITIGDDLESHYGTFTNNGTLSITDNLLNEATVINNSVLNISNYLHNYYSGEFTNTGTFTTGELINNNDAEFTNSGIINIASDLLNVADFTNSDEINVSGVFINYKQGDFINNGDLTIAATYEVSGNMGILTIGSTGVLTIKGMFTNTDQGNAPGLIKNNGEFVLFANENDCATYVELGSMTGSGTSVFELFLEGGDWHYVAIPITSVSSNVFWGGAIYSYDEANSCWQKHGANENLDVTKGYDVYFKNDVTIRFEGTFRDGDQTSNITKKGSSSKGFNLIVNPYPASIDWKHNGWSKKNSADGVYVWNPGNQSISSYVNGVGSNGGSRYIPPTQAFFIKSSNTNGNVKATKNTKVHSKNLKPRSDDVVSDELLRIKVLAENGYSDETVIRFTDKSTVKFDDDFDADKMFSYNLSIPQLYTKSIEGMDLSINSIPEVKEEISIPLYCNTRTSGIANIMLDLENMDANVTVFLEDLKTANIHDMLTGAYTFNADVQDDANRFVIHFSKPESIVMATTEIDEESVVEKADANIYSSKGSLIVDLLNNEYTNHSIRIFSLNGKEVYQTQTTDFYTKIDLNLAIGYYVVQVENDDNSYSKKVIIW